MDAYAILAQAREELAKTEPVSSAARRGITTSSISRGINS